jgi:hypothetical protein
VPRADLLLEYSYPNGPSIGIIFEGKLFPKASILYKMEFNILYNGKTIATFYINELRFEKSGRLRILAKALQSDSRRSPWGTIIKPDITWFLDLFDAMQRIGAMLPVSEGIWHGSNPNDDDGLAFIVGENRCLASSVSFRKSSVGTR